MEFDFVKLIPKFLKEYFPVMHDADAREIIPQKKGRNLTPPNPALPGVGMRIMSFVKGYAEHFKSYRCIVSDKARRHTCGIPKKRWHLTLRSSCRERAGF